MLNNRRLSKRRFSEATLEIGDVWGFSTNLLNIPREADRKMNSCTLLNVSPPIKFNRNKFRCLCAVTKLSRSNLPHPVAFPITVRLFDASFLVSQSQLSTIVPCRARVWMFNAQFAIILNAESELSRCTSGRPCPNGPPSTTERGSKLMVMGRTMIPVHLAKRKRIEKGKARRKGWIDDASTHRAR